MRPSTQPTFLGACMNESSGNPLIVALLFVLRCVVPLVIMLGISYVLRRLGLLSEPAAPPREDNRNANGSQGNLRHG